jgi:hypothetical protein
VGQDAALLAELISDRTNPNRNKARTA